MSWFDDLVGWVGDNQGLVTLGAAGLTQFMGGNKTSSPPVGYQGSVPRYTAMREAVPMGPVVTRPDGTTVGQGALTNPQGQGLAQVYHGDVNRRPGSAGRRYFTDTQYVPKDDAAGIASVQQQQAEEVARLREFNRMNPMRQERKSVMPEEQRPADGSSVMVNPTIVKAADGGLMGLKKGRYLNGDTDGMADKVPARIDGEQEARLSDGEYVIPADVISHLGNGNSEAGAKVMDNFLARVRKERTGNEKQGKEINPDKLLPV
jgi:hypothetical protein